MLGWARGGGLERGVHDRHSTREEAIVKRACSRIPLHLAGDCSTTLKLAASEREIAPVEVAGAMVGW